MTQPKKTQNPKTMSNIIETPYEVKIPQSILPYEVAKGLTTFESDTGEHIVLAKDVGKYTIVPKFFFTSEDLAKMGRVVSLSQQSTAMDSSVVMKLKDGMSVRKNQEEAWAALADAPSGILNLACGKGKTFLALNKIAHEKVKTIIIAPQVAHLKNWESELERFFDFTGTTGWIKGPKCESADIIFATVQTLAKDPLKYKKFLRENNVGMAIFDECHCMSAKYFSRAADLVGGTRIGLSATPNRKDRNEGIFSAHVGQVFYSDTEQDLTPTVYIKNTKISKQDAARKIGKENHIAKLRNYLVEHKDRNDYIISLVNQKLTEGRTIYVLSHSVSHVEFLASQFPNSTYIHGGVPADKRIDLLNKGNPVVATVSIGREAYNRVDLDTLMIVTPFSADSHSAITLEQSVGRILRAAPNKKTPEVFFFRDPDVNGMLTGMLRSVIRESNRRGYNVIGNPPKSQRKRKF